MVKKVNQEKLKDDIKNLYSEYMDRVIHLFIEFMEGHVGSIVEWLKNITRIKQIIRKYVISVIVGISALTVTLLGVSNILATYVSSIPLGWWQLMVGLVALLIISMYMRK